MLNSLEATIQKIIAESASTMADQIAQSVRQSLATEIMGASASAFSAAKISMPAALTATAAPKRRGRPPGSGKKAAPAPAPVVHTPAPAAKAAPAPKTKARRKSGKRRSIAQHELDQVLSILAKKPGLSSVQIQKEAGIDKAQAARVLTKLRGTKQVSLKGKRSKAMYSVA